MDKTTHPYFVENGESQRETAILLVGTATEHGIDQRDIATVQGGFRISEALAVALDLDEDDADTEGSLEPRVGPEGVDPNGHQGVIPEVGDDLDDEFADLDDDLDSEPTEAIDYGAYDYADLKALVDERGLETADRKTATLVAALQADDAENAAQSEGDDTTTSEED